MPFPFPPFFCFLALSDGICYEIFSCNFSRQWIKSFTHSWNQFHMNFFLGALTSSRQQILCHFKVPPQSDGNKSFAIASRFLKAMATNPLPILQGFLKAIATNLLSFLQGFLKAMASLGNLLKGSWKRFSYENLVPFLATDPSPFLPRFPKVISYETMVLLLATNPSPCLQHSWKQILVKSRCCSWQQILRHAFKFLKAISYQILVAFLATSSFTTPSRFLTTISYEIDLAAIPSNKYFPISSRVPESNFLWNPSWWQFLMKSWWHFQQIAFHSFKVPEDHLLGCYISFIELVYGVSVHLPVVIFHKVTTTVHSLSSFPQIVAEISLQSSLVKDWSNVVFLY